MKKPVVGMAVVALIYSCTACASSSAPTSAPVSGAGQTPSGTVSAAAVPSPSSAAVLTQPKPNVASTAGKILGTGTFPDGVAFEIRYRVVKASPQAVGAEDGRIVILDLTATNHSSDPISLGAMGADIAYNLSEAVPPLAEQAIDPAVGVNDVNVFDPAPLQSGESRVLTDGYGIPAAAMNSVTVEVFGPDLGSDPIKVRGALGDS